MARRKRNKWSDGSKRRKPTLVVDTPNGMPFHCPNCKKAQYYNKEGEKEYRCQSADTK